MPTLEHPAIFSLSLLYGSKAIYIYIYIEKERRERPEARERKAGMVLVLRTGRVFGLYR